MNGCDDAGRIRAESAGAGLGARFTFTLPAAEETEAAGAPPAHGRGSEPARVLVVDDDPETLRHAREAPELADLPVIFISAYGHEETVVRALDGLGEARGRGRAGGAQLREKAPPQARRRPRAARLHPQRARRRLPHAEARRGVAIPNTGPP